MPWARGGCWGQRDEGVGLPPSIPVKAGEYTKGLVDQALVDQAHAWEKSSG